MKIPAVALAALLASLPLVGAGQVASPNSYLPEPQTPAPVKRVLAARRFTLTAPFHYTSMKEPRLVSAGTLVVLEVDPAYVVPRNSPQPILFAGNVVVQRLNRGNLSGRVIGIIPGDVDFAATPIWFGTPALASTITPAMIDAERSLADKAGIRPAARSKIDGKDGAPIAAKDFAALLRNVGADLLQQYSPHEKSLAAAWRAPVGAAPVILRAR